jgi:hypothetical protein
MTQPVELQEFQVEVSVGFWIPVKAVDHNGAQGNALIMATKVVRDGLKKANITSHGVDVRCMKDAEGRHWAFKKDAWTEVDWVTLERLGPSTRRARYEEIKKHYEPMQDSVQELEDGWEADDEPPQFLFVEQSSAHRNHWFHSFETLIDAADHYRSNYDPEEWVVKLVIDLDTGKELPFEIGFNFTFPQKKED